MTGIEGPNAARSGLSLRTTIGSSASWHTRSRLLVHVGLLATAAGALVTLQFLHIRVAIHTVVGLVFVALVLVHLLQRRRTIRRWATQLRNRARRGERLTRLLYSDVLLGFITVNVLVSGVLDWNRGQPTTLPLPLPLSRWHLLSGAALVIDLAVHVWHRRKRLRRSFIQ